VKYASDVTGVTIADFGHWIYEEHPEELTAMLLGFLGRPASPLEQRS